jgi:hypothetical protein
MIQSKDRRQKELIKFIPQGTERYHKMLKGSVYRAFRKDILPDIPVDFSAKHFYEEFGRPTKDLQSIVAFFAERISILFCARFILIHHRVGVHA